MIFYFKSFMCSLEMYIIIVRLNDNVENMNLLMELYYIFYGS